MLKYLRIGFGTDKTPGLDIDPTMDLIAHIIECIGVLRDVNKVVYLPARNLKIHT